jgi:predicted nucleotidyltransferase
MRAAGQLAFLLVVSPHAAAQVVFTEVARESGIDFRHRDGGCGKRYFAEQVGGGVAFVDADGDGRLDLYFLSGAALPGCEGPAAGDSRFYRNLGSGKFADATREAGLGEPGYATGCAAGDHDGDGDVDLYVTCYGPNRLYRNDGGRFAEVGREAGVDDRGFGASATFLDHDRDGDLDLYVANYVDVTAGKEKACTRGGLTVYCQPQEHPGQPDVFYENLGGGKFRDATREAGVWFPRARGLGVAAGDFDDDGDLDLYVANDTNENLLFRNQGGGKFAEVGLEAGVALGEDGVMENGMGTDWGDCDGDGRLDLVVTNFDAQPNRLYRNLGGGFFADVSFACGIGGPSYPYVGWAAIFADFDLDSRLDLFITNGHVFDNVAEFQEGSTHAQPNLLHLNAGEGRFRTVQVTGAGIEPRVSRGAAAGDYDDDGDVDLAVNNLNGAPFLLRNDTPRAGRRWLGLRLVGTRSNRSAIGARAVLRVGGSLQVREVKSGSGYLSQNDMRLLFGLGETGAIESLTIRWPSGAVEEAAGRASAGDYTTLRELKP